MSIQIIVINQKYKYDLYFFKGKLNNILKFKINIIKLIQERLGTCKYTKNINIRDILLNKQKDYNEEVKTMDTYQQP